MYKTEGYWNVTPRIKSLSFPKRGKFQVDLQDGRSIVMPISAFANFGQLSKLCPRSTITLLNQLN